MMVVILKEEMQDAKGLALNRDRIRYL